MKDIQYLVSIIQNNFTKFHVHTAISFPVISKYMGGSFSNDSPNLADSATGGGGGGGETIEKPIAYCSSKQ